jgi:hypothetical protein
VQRRDGLRSGRGESRDASLHTTCESTWRDHESATLICLKDMRLLQLQALTLSSMIKDRAHAQLRFGARLTFA